MLDDTLLDDPARLADVDSGGLLRLAALFGAQVRATAETAAEVGLDDLADDRPRAVVLLTRPGVSANVARLLLALTGARCPVPVVAADELPSWVGALDVVFAHTDDVGDVTLAESVATACRRGASVVLAAPSDGPVAAAGAGRAKLLVPRVPVPPALAFAYVFAAGISTFRALGLLDFDVEELAEELDKEAERAHPGHESLSNPAKSLALRMAERTPLLWGLGPVTTAVAAHASFALGAHAGVPAHVTDYPQAVAQRGLHRAAAAVGSEADIFADPDDEPGVALRVFLISTRHDERVEVGERSALRDLPGADVVAPGDTVRADPLLRAAVLAARFDLAAVYLGLAAGTLNGPGWPALAMS
ncbi:SIS domain-containing protein [Saccharopolyspora flava]|uniref:Phospho-glucose isomerase C-terminal SIS domain-containing protein n=1 Tax=Saccharopolyspora flava TaxID=95161 RepID=A0A1I6PJB2_9PSEU|nr:SIS domain-containing protein [Saccharopolyspora flava]SFS40256.1 phospho-glucose isomerase C-terminal SIS domain-containing protein [Saccharopolyspora flava]